MKKIDVNEFSFLIIDNEATMIIPAQEGDRKYAELFYNGNNVLLLKIDDKILVLKNLDKNVRSILKKQENILICEEAPSHDFTQAYTVNIQIDSTIPDVDTVEQDFDKDMLFLKDIFGMESYDTFKCALGF